MESVLLASFLGHMAADTGLFGPLEPVSFVYVTLQGYRLPFAIAAVTFALLAGRLRRWKLKENHGIVKKQMTPPKNGLYWS